MITILYGSDRYFLNEKVKQLCQEQPLLKGITPLIYDATRNSFNYDFLFEEMMTISLFDPVKCLILVNPLAQHAIEMTPTQQKQWAELIATLPSEVILFVLLEQTRFDSKHKIMSPLLKVGIKMEVPALKPYQLQQVIMQMSKEKGLRIDSKALEHLVTILPNHMPTIVSELDKLAAYPNPITIEVVTSLIKQPLQDNVFELSKAIMTKNLSLAFKIYQDLTTLKHDPVSLIPAIAWQYRMMYQILTYQQQKLTVSQIKDKLQLSEYAFDKAAQYARLTNQLQVMTLLDYLAALDQDIKTGRKDKRLGFEMFLIEAMR